MASGADPPPARERRRASAVQLQLGETEPHLAGEIEQRRAQQPEREDEDPGDHRLVPEPSRALANGRITSAVVQIALHTAKKIDLFM